MSSDIISFLYDLNEVGIVLWNDQGKLKYRLLKDIEDKQVFFNKIKTHKTELLAFLADNKINSPDIQLPVLYQDHSLAVRAQLSFAQQRLWFIDQFEGNTAAYNIPWLLAFEYEIKAELLASAFEALLDKHQILRTTFFQDESHQDYQTVSKQELEIKVVTLKDRLFAPETGQLASQANTMLKTEAEKPFDLRTELPIRVILYQSEVPHKGLRSTVFINIHHIAFDGWSINVFMRDLLALYWRHESKDSSGDVQISVQYRDYAAWQKWYLSAERIRPYLDYWKNHLLGFEPLELTTDFPRPKQINYQGDLFAFSLSSQLSANLKKMAKQQGVTLYTVLLSGFFILLNRYTNQQDLVVGSPFANRDHHQLQDVIGFFINSLPIRVTLQKDMSFDVLLESVDRVIQQTKQYQALPFEQLIDLLDIERDISRHPIFQVLFSVQDFGRNLENDQYHLIDLQDCFPSAKYDLEFVLDGSTECIQGQVKYATKLYKKSTVEQMVQHFQYLLEQIMAQPTASIFEYAVLAEAEYQKIIYQWNDFNQPFRQDKTLGQLFEDQVKKSGNHIAVIFNDSALTYRELNEKSNRLASFIRKQYRHAFQSELSPDCLVSLLLDRSIEMIVSIL